MEFERRQSDIEGVKLLHQLSPPQQLQEIRRSSGQIARIAIMRDWRVAHFQPLGSVFRYEEMAFFGPDQIPPVRLSERYHPSLNCEPCIG